MAQYTLDDVGCESINRPGSKLENFTMNIVVHLYEKYL